MSGSRTGGLGGREDDGLAATDQPCHLSDTATRGRALRAHHGQFVLQPLYLEQLVPGAAGRVVAGGGQDEQVTLGALLPVPHDRRDRRRHQGTGAIGNPAGGTVLVPCDGGGQEVSVRGDGGRVDGVRVAVNGDAVGPGLVRPDGRPARVGGAVVAEPHAHAVRQYRPVVRGVGDDHQRAPQVRAAHDVPGVAFAGGARVHGQGAEAGHRHPDAGGRRRGHGLSLGRAGVWRGAMSRRAWVVKG
ncbi:hypothetical protein GCM10020000_87130 [Streptomyces olivoverticillatus]